MLLLFIRILSFVLHLLTLAFITPTNPSILMLFTLLLNILTIRNRLWPINTYTTFLRCIQIVITELVMPLVVICFPCMEYVHNLEHLVSLEIIHFLQLLDMFCYVC